MRERICPAHIGPAQSVYHKRGKGTPTYYHPQTSSKMRRVMDCRSTAALRSHAGAPDGPHVAIRPKLCCTRTSCDRVPTERRNSRLKSSCGDCASYFKKTCPKPLACLKLPVRPPSVGLAHTNILKRIPRILKSGDVNTLSLLVSFRAVAIHWISNEPVLVLRPDQIPHDACAGFLVGSSGTSEPSTGGLGLGTSQGFSSAEARTNLT